MPTAIAVAGSDLHLCHNPPIARAAEPDWYQAMERTLGQVDKLCQKHACPFLIAGDIFDKWNSPAELINFAMRHLPKVVYAIPGNHDLPNHNIKQIERSAYWSLVEAGRVTNVDGLEILETNNHTLHIHGYPYGDPVNGLSMIQKEPINIALCHEYIYTLSLNPAKSDKKNSDMNSVFKRCKGFDFALFGDNHIPFRRTGNVPVVINCGGLFRRRHDERKHQPMVYILYDDKSFECVQLDVSDDKWVDRGEDLLQYFERAVRDNMLESVVNGLQDISSNSTDFKEVMRTFLWENDIGKNVRRILLEALED